MTPPIYDYQCGKCGDVVPEIRCISNRDMAPDCKRCKKPMTRQISPVRGIVKNPAVPRRSR